MFKRKDSQNIVTCLKRVAFFSKKKQKKEKKMLNYCILGNAVYCVVKIIFNGIIVFICNIFMSFKVFSACFACFIAKKNQKLKPGKKITGSAKVRR